MKLDPTKPIKLLKKRPRVKKIEIQNFVSGGQWEGKKFKKKRNKSTRQEFTLNILNRIDNNKSSKVNRNARLNIMQWIIIVRESS